MPTFVLVVIVTLCTIFSQLILKRGVGQLVEVLKEAGRIEFIMSAATSPYVIAALSLQGAGYVVWLFVLTQERLSVAFAMSGSFFYILMAAASWFFYDERLSLGQWAGLFIISIGVLMVNLLKT
jgi:drug/metabolite transporter (DMT)-like permease